jgi:hypothetical protein
MNCWALVRTDAKTAAFALIEHKEHTNMKPKNTICLWFDKDAHEAARFYAVIFPDSKVTAVHEAPGDYPGGKKGDVLTVEFTVLGIPLRSASKATRSPSTASARSRRKRKRRTSVASSASTEASPARSRFPVLWIQRK